MIPEAPQLSEQHLLIFLLQVLLLLGLARGLGVLCSRFGQPRLVGEILVGILLGPTLLGRVAPALSSFLFPADLVQLAMLETVAWFGVLFLLLETGLEVDLNSAWRLRGPALRIGIIGVLMPLAIGFSASLALPVHYLPSEEHRVVFALFLGTAMAISAMVIIARVLRELDLLKSDLGLVTLCGYAVNDVLAWVLFSLVLALGGRTEADLPGLGAVLAVTLAFTAFALTIGPRLTRASIVAIGERLPEQPGAVLSFVVCLGLLCGAVTGALGLTALLGFFLAGIMAGEARLSEHVRAVITQMVHAIFVPLYFAGLALHVDFLSNFDLRLVGFVTVISISAKFVGAWLGTLGTGLSRQDRTSIGIAFTPSGVTGIVVASVALEAGILTVPVFVALVISAVVSSLLVGPWLSWSIRRRGEVDLMSYVARAAVVEELAAATRYDALAELCSRAARSDRRLDGDALMRAVREREELMGTALGEGVAIAHARLPDLHAPLLAFGRSRDGIDWDAPDGLPVHLVFLLLTPAPDDGLQLQILAALAQRMGSPNACKRVIRAEPGVWAALRESLRA
ncbi:MAG: hypothetical protein CL908_09660 [Deltaproteobacteria bacterium]|nr:hypothetical protein [Deltaproteobacteria bacterium]